MNTCIVQLSRIGDILSALPIAKHFADEGHAVDWIVQPTFTEIVRAASYVRKVHEFNGAMMDVRGGVDMAERLGGYDQVLVTQVNGNPVKIDPAPESFQAEQWARAGLLHRFHDLPLVLDARDASRDEEIVDRYFPKTDRPVLAYNLRGHSSPYKDSRDFEQWLHRCALVRGYTLLNLGGVNLPAFYDLVPLLERSAYLLTIDTATLHLAYATMTPTIAMVREHSYHASEPRRHWVERVGYGESCYPSGREKIDRILRQEGQPRSLCRAPLGMMQRRIVHVADWYTPADVATHRRQMAARVTWDATSKHDRAWTTVLHELQADQRSSRDIGDTRRVPYVRDVIDKAASLAGDGDILCLTNADTFLTIEAPAYIRRALEAAPCCYSGRIDLPRCAGRQLDLSQIRGRSEYVGTDLFAFTRAWWEKVRPEWPDMLLACEGWDFVLRKLIDRDNPRGQISPAIVYHEMHPAFWARNGNLKTNPGNLHNQALGRAWAVRNGLERYIGAGDYLFKCEKDVANG